MTGGVASPARGQAVLTRAVERRATAFDVVMCYQVFLGRDPETEHIVDVATRDPVRVHIRAFLSSDEFETEVLKRLRQGGRLPHERLGPGPSSAHLAWVARHLQLPAGERAALARLRGWDGLLTLICRADGRDWGDRDNPALRLAEHVSMPRTVLLRPDGDCVIGVGEVCHEHLDGWAVLASDPRRPLDVEFGIEGEAIARQRAEGDRPEVALLFGGDGRAGFSFGPLPALAEGIACVGLLRVSVAGEDRPLTEWLRICVPPETEP